MGALSEIEHAGLRHSRWGGQRERRELDVTPVFQSGWNPSVSVLESRPFSILETVWSLHRARLPGKDEALEIRLHWGVFTLILLPRLPFDQARGRYLVERTQPLGIGFKGPSFLFCHQQHLAVR